MMLGSTTGLSGAVAQILGGDGRVAGAGFLVTEELLVTCAHVVEAAGSGPGEEMEVAFPRAKSARASRFEGQVLDGPWRGLAAQDVAVVRLHDLPTGIGPLVLGSAADCRGHRVRSFGYPAQAPPDGHFGYGRAGDLLPDTDGRGPHLQLTNANDLTTGFSGAPVLDQVTGLVVGMLTEITAPDAFERGQGIAYVTATEALREILPELAAQDICPYQGLESFTVEQARWFQGRKDAVRQVMASLARQRQLTLLLGPSGSGKSSLVQAGVLRALAKGELPGSDRWSSVLARPRQDPLAELEHAGLPGASTDGLTAAVSRRLAAESDGERMVLVVDQFEELFTRTPDDGQQPDRVSLVGQLTTAVDENTRLSVILVMRDDFYPQLAAQAPELLEAAMPGLLNVPNVLSRQDLHDIIALPARDVGARFQAGLPEQIIADVLAHAPDGPRTGQVPATVLPLLELTLKQLWERREDGFLTHEAYRRIGAVSGSLTLWCDAALEQLSDEQRPIARRILTSLVRPEDPGRQAPAVRAQVPLDELRDLAGDPNKPPDNYQDVDDVIAALTRHRIITTQTLAAPEGSGAPGRPVAELIHDALIRDWGTLHKWLARDHRFHEWLDSTRERRARWAEKKDPGDLLAGTALAEGLDLSRQHRLPGNITDFLAASKQRQQAVIRRSRALNTVLAVLLALALVAVGGALWQWQTAITAREAAQSRQLAAQSSELISTNPELASLLAVRAYRTNHNAQSREALRNAASLPKHQRLAGHTDSVGSVAFSRDGKTLATVGDDHTLRLWNADKGTPLVTRKEHTDEVYAVAFHPKDRTLATGGADGTVRLWNAADGSFRTVLAKPSSTVAALAFSPDGSTFATGNADGKVQLWDADSGALRTNFDGHEDVVYSLAFSPDGDTLATGGADGTLRLWDVNLGKAGRKLGEVPGDVFGVAFSPDGRSLASVSGDGVLRLWNPATGENRSYEAQDTPGAVAFSPDGRTVATGDDNVVQLWDAATGVALTGLVGHTNDVNALAFSPDGHQLASGSLDRTVRLWDMTSGAVRAPRAGHTGAVVSVAFSPDGDTLATGSLDRTAHLSDVRSGAVRVTLPGGDSSGGAVAISPDGRTVVTGDWSGTVRLWDADTGKMLKSWTEHEGVVNSVAFSPDSRTLATASSDYTVQLWDVRTRTPNTVLEGHTDGVNAVAFSPDGKTVATASSDTTVGLWDADTGSNRVFLKGHTDQVNAVAFSPDEATLASAGNDRTARLWDMASRKTRTTLIGHTDQLNAVAFSPDGRTVATGGIDSTARLWNVTSGKTLITLLGHSNAVFGLAFSPDGRTLATASADFTVRLWSTTIPRPEAALANICRTVGRDLTPQERTAYLPGQSNDPVCPSD